MTATAATSPAAAKAIDSFLAGRFNWTLGDPLVAPAKRPSDPCHAIKDATIVRYKGKWHLFCTIRSKKRSHQIEYLSFADWKDANKSRRHVLKLNDGFFCAPQIFYFRPHKKWYLIYQAIDESRAPALQPAFSTTDDITKPNSWTKTALLYRKGPKVKMWIDFWVICDETKAHLFFTSLNGRMWRAQTKLADFPHGWGRPKLVLKADIFEASHTYRLKGMDKYLTIVEAQDRPRRYFKAYLAGSLDGKWTPLAATKAKPLASKRNVRETGEHWTDSVSHGELLRAGYDQDLLVSPARLRLLIQGVTAEEMQGIPYGAIPWRLGLLEQAK